MYDIKDYHRYTTLMRNGFYDKLFFIDKIFGEWKTFLDVGCADGFLTKMIAEIFPDKHIIGYDKNPEMISRAVSAGTMPANVSFTTTLPTGGIDIAYFCSVLHEMIDIESRKEMISHVRGHMKLKYLIIRDMQYNYKNNILFSNRTNINKAIVEYLRSINKLGELERFESIYGNISIGMDLLAQFLLKYPYIESPNWDRELNEDYFNNLSLIQSSGFTVGSRLVYFHYYNVPYLEYKWENDFKFIGASHFFTTHAQKIYKYD